jgi:hypothetical protein
LATGDTGFRDLNMEKPTEGKLPWWGATKEQQSFRHQNKSSHELTCGEIVGRNTENTDRIENLV